MIDFSNLRTEIEANRSAKDSAKRLFATLVAEVEANKSDPAALQTLVDDLKANDEDLAAAVAANTPAAEPA
jgi:hypothetical protein